MVEKPNGYFKNLNKIEFVLTYECTGRCRHCSQGDARKNSGRTDPYRAAEAVRKITSAYAIETVMVFGGEPLLCKTAVYEIMTAAAKAGVKRRQIITNGFVTRDDEELKAIAKMLSECGVNDVLLSVDAFHQEFIPIEPVRRFACFVKEAGVPIRLQPAWLVSPSHQNMYNVKTRELLDSFLDIGIFENEGNIIFPEGNAKIYLSEYFSDGGIDNPYVEDVFDVRCISFDPDGGVLDGNFYNKDILEIMKDYSPR